MQIQGGLGKIEGEGCFVCVCVGGGRGGVDTPNAHYDRARMYGEMPYLLRHWIPNPQVPCSKRQSGSEVDSAFQPSKLDKMGTRNFLVLSDKK